MVRANDIIALINPRLNRILTVAQAALPDRQFVAFRRVVLDEFGKSGLERDLDSAMQCDKERAGSGRNIHAGKEVPK
jgi:hypothetical protein